MLLGPEAADRWPPQGTPPGSHTPPTDLAPALLPPASAMRGPLLAVSPDMCHRLSHWMFLKRRVPSWPPHPSHAEGTCTPYGVRALGSKRALVPRPLQACPLPPNLQNRTDLDGAKQSPAVEPKALPPPPPSPWTHRGVWGCDQRCPPVALEAQSTHVRVF